MLYMYVSTGDTYCLIFCNIIIILYKSVTIVQIYIKTSSIKYTNRVSYYNTNNC